VFTLPQAKKRSIDTIDGRFTVLPLGPSLPLYALAPASANAVARGVLGRFAKDGVYSNWLMTQEDKLLGKAICSGDQLPTAGDVELGSFVPFLGE
jgi:hypothetical protein